MAHVYLLHFSEPLAGRASHYCGHTPNGVQARVEKHRRGTGASITRAAVEAGIRLDVVKTWSFESTHDARLFERALKDSHSLARFCPRCKRRRKRQQRESARARRQAQA